MISRLARLFEAPATLSLVGSLLGHFGRAHWLLDICSHFRLQYLVVGLCSSVLSLSACRRRWALLGLVLVVHNGFLIAPFVEVGREPVRGASLKVMTINVQSGNRHVHRALEVIRRADPDVVVLTELSERWQAGLASLRESHPWHLEHPRRDNFGIAVYSRVTLDDARVVWVGTADVPSIRARLKPVAGVEIGLVGTHPLPPRKADYFAWRNEQLQSLARSLSQESGDWIVAGDFNLTPWSPWHEDFESISGLRNTRRGRGLHPSWPALPALFSVPLDHVFITPGLESGRVEASSAFGSDHRAVTVEVALPDTMVR